MEEFPCVDVVEAHTPYGLAFCGSLYFACLLFIQWKTLKTELTGS